MTATKTHSSENTGTISYPDRIQSEFNSELSYYIDEKPDDFFPDFKIAHMNSSAMYSGYHIPSAPWPITLSEANISVLKKPLEGLMELLEEFTETVINTPLLRKHYLFSDSRWNLIETASVKSRAIPFARMDAYWDGKSLKILEVNTDGSSGMSNSELITSSFLNTPAVSELSSKWNIKGFQLMNGVLSTLLEDYCRRRDIEIKKAENIVDELKDSGIKIGIMDWSGTGTSAEFSTLADYFSKCGFQTTVFDPRDVDIRSGKLFAMGKPIDLIYRRMVSSEFFSRLEECQSLYNAVKEDVAVVSGSFRSDIAFNKRTLALISDPAFERWMPDNIDYIREIIPWTRLLDDSHTDWEGNEVSLPELAISAREELVLKPGELYAGRGVLVGLETSPEVWNEAVQTALLTGGFILQKRVKPSEITLPPIGRKDIELSDQDLGISDERVSRTYHTLLGPFMFNGKLKGFLARLTPDLHLSGDSMEITLPVVHISRKDTYKD